MDENLHNDLDKLFHDSIEPLSELPEKHVWENIEQQLDKDNAEKYKRKFIIWRSIAGIFILLLLSFATFNLINNNDKIKNVTGMDNSIIKKDRPSDSSDSSINNYRQRSRLNHSSVTIPFFNQNRKSHSLKQKWIVKIKNGSTGQELPAYQDIQQAQAANSTKPVREAIVNNINENGLFNTSLFQDQGMKMKDLNTPIISHLILKANKKSNHIFPRSFFTVFAAPEFANYTLEDDETNHYENKQVIQKRETHLLSYAAGVLISYNINKKFSLQSGITWSSSNINIDPDKIYAAKDNSGTVKYIYNTSSGYGYILPSFSLSPQIGDSLYTRTSVHTLQFISIPVLARYRFVHKKFSLNPGVGIAFNFLTKASLTTEVNDNTSSESEVITKLNGLKKINYSFLLSSELQYQVSKKWAFIAAPYFKYALAPINNGNVVKTYPYNIGIGFGVEHKLRFGQ